MQCWLRVTAQIAEGITVATSSKTAECCGGGKHLTDCGEEMANMNVRWANPSDTAPLHPKRISPSSNRAKTLHHTGVVQEAAAQAIGQIGRRRVAGNRDCCTRCAVSIVPWWETAADALPRTSNRRPAQGQALPLGDAGTGGGEENTEMRCAAATGGSRGGTRCCTFGACGFIADALYGGHGLDDRNPVGRRCRNRGPAVVLATARERMRQVTP